MSVACLNVNPGSEIKIRVGEGGVQVMLQVDALDIAPILVDALRSELPRMPDAREYAKTITKVAYELMVSRKIIDKCDMEKHLKDEFSQIDKW